MPTIIYISPLDQPLGNRRLLNEIRTCLTTAEFDAFGFAVAFARISPLLKLHDAIQSWRKAGKKTTAIFGIDLTQTSQQAIEYAVENFERVCYTQDARTTFHPKIFWFTGPSAAVVFVGSNNLTTGGMETNFEAAIGLRLSIPSEQHILDSLQSPFFALLPEHCDASKDISTGVLADLITQGVLLDEKEKKKNSGKTGVLSSRKSGLPIVPAEPMPSSIMQAKTLTKKALAAQAAALSAQAQKLDILKELIPVNGLAIQIIVHSNGEIHLSTTATKQNPAFFGIPFTGWSIPKKETNKPYPQREPDPKCRITVIGTAGEVLYSNPSYDLNTVIYTGNSEIRVTAKPLHSIVPDYSILVMQLSADTALDYNMVIHTPESPEYALWVNVCNQTMPSGGLAIPRRFGWY